MRCCEGGLSVVEGVLCCEGGLVGLSVVKRVL